MNITEPEYTTKADVVGGEENSDQEEDKKEQGLKDPNEFVEVQKDENLNDQEDLLDNTGYSDEESEPLDGEINTGVDEKLESLVDAKSSTTTQVSDTAEATTPKTLKEKNTVTVLADNNLEDFDTNIGNSSTSNFDNNSNNDDDNNNNNNDDDNHHHPEQHHTSLDLVSVKYTTILLRLFAPESTTTAEPKVGYVQQVSPGKNQQPDDESAFQKSPIVDNPQTLDVEHKVNTTSAISVTPPTSTNSLSTKYTTTSIDQPQGPVLFNSTPPRPPPEVEPTNATILVVGQDVQRISSSGSGVKPPAAWPTGTPPATTAHSGLAAGTLLACIIPIIVIIFIILFVAFIFVRRRKQFNKKRKGVLVDKENVEEQIELNPQPEEPKNISTEKLYAKVDKSRKSRISSSDETTPLTTVLINGGPHLSTHSEAIPDAFHPDDLNLESDDVAFVDNDLYEKDSEGDRNSATGPLTVSNYPDEDETYEIPEDVVNQLEHDHLVPPVPPVRTSSSPRNSAYFAATPPVPHRHSSLALTSMTPPLPPRHSSLLSTPRRPESKSFDKLDLEQTPQLPPRLSLMLPVRSSSASPEQKRATITGNFVPMPLSKRTASESSTESDTDTSSDESDFEELPPPREHAPPLPEGAEAATPSGATGGATGKTPDAAESEYLEPISLMANGGDDDKNDDDHDYDPVYIPSNPGASHIAHLVDNTNYLKGARNRSPSKASINPYEEIQFGTQVYADVDESTMTSPPIETSTPAPPRLTPRSSRLSDLITTPPQLSPRSPGANSTTQQIPSRPPSSISGSTPQLPPRSPAATNNSNGPILSLQNGALNLPTEPRYSGLLLDSEDELNVHDYTPLDYEDHSAADHGKTQNATNGNNVDKSETAENVTSNSKINDDNKDDKNKDSSDVIYIDEDGLDNEEQTDYTAVPTDDNQNTDEIYEPIEGADKDGIYEAIDFGDD